MVNTYDHLAAAVLAAVVAATPFGSGSATPAFSHPDWALRELERGLS